MDVVLEVVGMGDVVEPQALELLGRAPHDGGERPVHPDEAAGEVHVGDPDRGALEHRPELVVLLPPQRLEAPSGRDVRHQGEHQRVAVVAVEHAHELVHPCGGAVGPQVAVLDLEELVVAGEQSLEGVEALGVVVRVDEAGDRDAREVALGSAHEAGLGGVAAHDVAVPVGDRHARGSVVEHGPQPRLGRGDGQRVLVVGPCPGRHHHRGSG